MYIRNQVKKQASKICRYLVFLSYGKYRSTGSNAAIYRISIYIFFLQLTMLRIVFYFKKCKSFFYRYFTFMSLDSFGIVVTLLTSATTIPNCPRWRFVIMTCARGILTIRHAEHRSFCLLRQHTGSIHATGVLPQQSKGKDIFPMGAGCHNPSCACHVPDSLGMACGKCSTCFH